MIGVNDSQALSKYFPITEYNCNVPDQSSRFKAGWYIVICTQSPSTIFTQLELKSMAKQRLII